MMLRTLLLILFCSSIPALAQEKCLTAEKHLEAMKDPAVVKEREELEAFTKSFISAPPSATRAVISIPVVVHVIYRTADQNIPDDRIFGQIDILNRDYSLRNQEVPNIPTPFNGIAADTEIQFCLAETDPAGNPTSGITRRQTTVTEIGSTSYYYSTAQGGTNAWPRSQYLNIWVTEMGGGALGFAYKPGAAGPENDGMVINYKYFGATGSPPYHLGRTATHELGHFFNLEHTWGDDNGACTGSDFVDDTPNQASNSSGCPAFPLTDACTPNSPGVMYMNFMDYTNDECMAMFTQGQKARMQAALASSVGERSSLANSGKCTVNVGIQKASESADRFFWPNPATSEVIISAGAEAVTFTIYDHFGKVVASGAVDRGLERVDISGLRSGVYSVSLRSESGISSGKLVVR